MYTYKMDKKSVFEERCIISLMSAGAPLTAYKIKQLWTGTSGAHKYTEACEKLKHDMILVGKKGDGYQINPTGLAKDFIEYIQDISNQQVQELNNGDFQKFEDLFSSKLIKKIFNNMKDQGVKNLYESLNVVFTLISLTLSQGIMTGALMNEDVSKMKDFYVNLLKSQFIAQGIDITTESELLDEMKMFAEGILMYLKMINKAAYDQIEITAKSLATKKKRYLQKMAKKLKK